jgi:hypothetical protein
MVSSVVVGQIRESIDVEGSRRKKTVARRSNERHTDNHEDVSRSEFEPTATVFTANKE